MQRADIEAHPAPDEVLSAVTAARLPAAPSRPSRAAISVAMLAAVACTPIVVAVGFLTDRPKTATIPGDISVLALRGGLDGADPDHAAFPIRAAY